MVSPDSDRLGYWHQFCELGSSTGTLNFRNPFGQLEHSVFQPPDNLERVFETVQSRAGERIWTCFYFYLNSPK